MPLKNIYEMSVEMKSTVLGSITGTVTKIITGDVMSAIWVAMLTGGAAYIGQIIVKEAHKWLKEKFRKTNK